MIVPPKLELLMSKAPAPPTPLEVLLLEDAVELLALDDRVAAVAHQVGDEHIGDAFADVLIAAEEIDDPRVHRGVIEVQHRDAALGGGLLRRQGARETDEEERLGQDSFHTTAPSGEIGWKGGEDAGRPGACNRAGGR